MTSTDHVPPYLPLVPSECGFPKEFLISNQPTSSLQRAMDPDQPLDFSTKNVRTRNKLSSIFEAQGRSFSDTPIQTGQNRTAEQLKGAESFAPSAANLERNHKMNPSSHFQSNEERKLMEHLPAMKDQSASLNNLLSSEISLSDINTATPLVLPNSTVEYKKHKKFSRQSRAYPPNPLSVSSIQGYYNYPFHSPLTADAVAHKPFLSGASEQAYLQFRQQMLKIYNMQDCQRSSSPPQNTGQSDNFEVKSSSQSECSATVVASELSNSEAVNTNTDSSEVARTDTSTYSMVASSITTGTTTIATATGTNSTSDVSLDGSLDNSKTTAINYTVSSDSGASTPTEPLGQSNFRKRSRSLTEEQKDDAYWERRRKNNEAAKRSRNARRAKEYEIGIRAAYLEQENLKLRIEVASLKNETVKLRCLLYNS
ncbi:uncharacterized protein LOC106462684 [Limulus polyphemus]|uniref:Uncharacterized protein LOC106462684 n=1 Tax=Limulus polyphemus TaxID=6850 RepID=A0ABM1BAF8_LIMPO|nr:uncharacterized protein LOC106462684 [Limulus polyphemus]